jgi:hypothetical protein
MATVEDCKEIVWLKGLYAELCEDNSCLFCDHQSALTKDQMFHDRTTRIDVKYHYVRYIIFQGKLKVCKISTHGYPADMMTLEPKVSSLLFRENIVVHATRWNLSKGEFYCVRDPNSYKRWQTSDERSETRR